MSEPSVVDAARTPRDEATRPSRSPGGATVTAPTRFHRGAHPPYAIRWFGSTALLGHLRRVAASIVASQAVDTRDWMRPERPHELLGHAGRILRAPGVDARHSGGAPGRPLWIDFVADTGDDRDVSARGGAPRVRGVRASRERRRRRSCRVATSCSSGATPPTLSPPAARSCGAWSSRGTRCSRRSGRAADAASFWASRETTTGTTGSTGLPGCSAGMRWSACSRSGRRGARTAARKGAPGDRSRAALVRQLHLDEIAGSVDLIRSAYQSLRAIVRGGTVHRVARLALRGYMPIQEASHWALPLAPGLELWGVDRQLRRLDFRQRTFFIERRAERPTDRLVFLAPDPALSFGERNPVGTGHAGRVSPHARDRTACSI